MASAQYVHFFIGAIPSRHVNKHEYNGRLTGLYGKILRPSRTQWIPLSRYVQLSNERGGVRILGPCRTKTSLSSSSPQEKVRASNLRLPKCCIPPAAGRSWKALSVRASRWRRRKFSRSLAIKQNKLQPRSNCWTSSLSCNNRKTAPATRCLLPNARLAARN